MPELLWLARSVFLTMPLLLLGVTLLASCIPARRATRLDRRTAFRAD
jgi:ABC-type lipoprotein release transport system permease subunit